MSVNILNKEIKKAYSPQLTLCPFHHKRSRELSSKKNKKRTLINVLNKKIKKNKHIPLPLTTLRPFCLERSRELFSKKKNQKRMLVNVLNKKIKKKSNSPPPGLLCVHF